MPIREIAQVARDTEPSTGTIVGLTVASIVAKVGLAYVLAWALFSGG